MPRNTSKNTSPLRLGAIALFALAGSLGGCSYDQNSEWSTTAGPEAKPLAKAQKTNQGPTDDTYTGTMMRNENDGTVWEGVFADAETEPKPVGNGAGAGNPIDLFGSVEGRAIIQGNPDAPAAFDPADLHRVTFSTYGSDFDPFVSNDGQYVFFASTQHRETADIYRKHVNSSVVTQITSDPGHDVMPALSPDGRTIAFASNRQGNWNIYVIDADGGQARQVTDDSSHELHPSFSPDGSQLVYARLGPVSQRWEMWLVDVNNPMVKHQIGFGLFPEFCPQGGTGTSGGDRIVFQRARERGSRLFSIWSLDLLAGREVTNLTELASSADHALINPTWSRDGKRVAYASVQLSSTTPSGQPTRADIWMTNIDGTGSTNLTADDAINLMPAWGENNAVFFISNRSGTDNIWSLGASKAVIAAGEPFVGLPNAPRTAQSPQTGQSNSSQNSTVVDFPASSVPVGIE